MASKPRKPHPADLATLATIERAVRFDVAMFLGAGRFENATALTLAEARVEAARLAAEHPNGRRPLIYGVTAEGRSGLVTDAILNLMESTEMAKSKKVAKPAAKRSTKAKVLARDAAEAKAALGIPAAVATDLLPESVVLIGLDDPVALHNTIADAVGEPGMKLDVRANTIGDMPAFLQRKAPAAAAEAPAPADAPAIAAPAGDGPTKTVEAKPAKGKAGNSKPAKAEGAKAAKAAKPAKAAKAAKPEPEKAAKADKPVGKRAAILAAAQAGKLPSAPDFSADTHTRFRPKLAEVVAMAKARDLKGLKAFKYEGFVSSSPKAILRYRDLCVIALEAQRRG